MSTVAGNLRRARLLEATIRVLAREGPGGLTHRAVADEASIPLAATTYYFSSKDELLREALNSLAREEATKLAQQRDALGTLIAHPGAVAGAIAAVLASQDGLAAKFELYLAASRTPEVRGAAHEWISTFRDLAAEVVGPESAGVLVAAIDGLVLHDLAEHGEVAAGPLAARIERLLVALRD